MASILDSLPAAINGAFKVLFYNAVMTKYLPGSGPEYDPGPPTAQSFPCKAFVTKYSAYYKANSLVDASDRKVTVLARSLQGEPEKGATLTVQGVSFTIIDYDDGGSAGAIWELQGRMG